MISFDKLTRRILYSHVLKNEAGLMLLPYLCRRYSRHDADGWRSAILERQVEVNGQTATPETLLKEHDRVSFYPNETAEPEADLNYNIAYEDEHLLVIDKPAHLCVHPTGPFFRHTLWHLAGSKYGRVYFVNRLDRETSGLLLAARNAETAAKMDPKNFPVHKEYLALVFGNFSTDMRAQGVLVRDMASIVPKKKRFILDGTPSNDAESADTELRFEAKVEPDMTLVRAMLHTGRQHQIRSTLYSLGYPVVGDKLYGPDEQLFLKIKSQTLTPGDFKTLRLDRQALHSAVLSFQHPVTGQTIRCESPVDFKLL